MQEIPLSAVPSQTMNVVLSGQSCTLDFFTLSTGLYANVSLNGVDVATGVLCQNLNRIVRSSYSGFEGDLVFTDTLGESDPVYTGLGDQYRLIYLEASEIV